MGARLAAQVLGRWTHVSDRAFRVLMRMAVTALDEGNPNVPAGIYFGGRDLLAMTLRNERGGSYESLLRTVKKATAELVKEGAIERANYARAGANGVYRLTLDGARSTTRNAPSDRTEGDPSGPPADLFDTPAEDTQGDPSGPPQGDSQGPPEGDSSGYARGTAGVPPRNHEEPIEERVEEKGVDLSTASHPLRAHEADANPDSSLPTKCPHNLPSRRRPDGKPSCALCRVGAPPSTRDLAAVIPLHARSAS